MFQTYNALHLSNCKIGVYNFTGVFFEILNIEICAYCTLIYNIYIMITVKAVTLNDVRSDEIAKEKYNSNNHWPDTGRPDDYDDVLQMGHTKHWIDLFHVQYNVVNIDPKDLPWMKRASKIGMYMGYFPKSFQEELDDSLKNYDHALFDGREFFVRSENVSLKYGCHGVGPYTGLKEIFESLVTSTSKHSPIHEDSTSIKLYLMPWKKINFSREFRIFVCKNKITAISQQNLYKVNKELSESKDITKDITKWVTKTIEYFNNVIKKKITYMDSYVMDFALLDSDNGYEPFYIETNAFGKEYASGSALFHWLLDEDILYGKQNNRNATGKPNAVHFRYTSSLTVSETVLGSIFPHNVNMPILPIFSDCSLPNNMV
jgi:hypothetical protein